MNPDGAFAAMKNVFLRFGNLRDTFDPVRRARMSVESENVAPYPSINAFKISVLRQAQPMGPVSTTAPVDESYVHSAFTPEVELWEEDDPVPHPDDIDELPDMSGLDDAEIYSSLTGDYSSYFEDSFSDFGGDYSAAEGLGADEIDWEAMDYE